MDPDTKIIFTAGAYFALYTTLATFFTAELIRLLVEPLLQRPAEPRQRPHSVAGGSERLQPDDPLAVLDSGQEPDV